MNEVIRQTSATRRGRNPKPAGVATLECETEEQRVRRLYAAQGGPLVSWLLDEARRRAQDLNQMAHELGVTYGYINQLRNGLRSTVCISPKFSAAVARYLGVPEVVVMIVCGRLGLSAFIQPQLTEEQFVDRAIGQMMDNPKVRAALPVDVAQLQFEARRALVALYSEAAGVDLLEMQSLPQAVQHLKSAAMQHELNKFQSGLAS